MKILFHGWECPPNGTGVGAYMLAMSQALAAAGNEVAFITGSHIGHPAEEDMGGVRIIREYDRSEVGSEDVARRVLGFARDFGADLIEGADHLGECAALLRADRHTPVLIKAHGPQCLRVLQRAQVFYQWQRFTLGVACLRAHRQLAAERYCLENADWLCVPSQKMLDWLRDEHFRIPARSGVVPYPVTDVPQACREDEAPEPTLLMAGRLAFMKGIEFLPSLIARLVSRFPALRIEIAGGDTYARGIGSIRKWMEEHLAGVANHVKFLGSLESAAMDAAYRRAWVVILPSRWDNFPNVILEAMIRARPVVASPVGGVPEMLAGTGSRVADPRTDEFASAVTCFLSDARLRLDAGELGRRKAVTEYAPRVVAEKYVQFVQNCLG
ncbi:MAG: glycosyltransferase family 4 protein [bacterium]